MTQIQRLQAEATEELKCQVERRKYEIEEIKSLYSTKQNEAQRAIKEKITEIESLRGLVREKVNQKNVLEEQFLKLTRVSKKEQGEFLRERQKLEGEVQVRRTAEKAVADQSELRPNIAEVKSRLRETDHQKFILQAQVKHLEAQVEKSLKSQDLLKADLDTIK